MKLIKQHTSIKKAAKVLKLSEGDIHSACNLTQNTCGGFVFRYVIDCRNKKLIPWKPDRKLDVLELINQVPKRSKINTKKNKWTTVKLQKMQRAVDAQKYKGSIAGPGSRSCQYYSSSLHWQRKKAIDKQKGSE